MCRLPRSTSTALVAAVLVVAAPLSAQQHSDDEQAHEHEHGLHFAHPIFTESVSPDRKVRIDYGRTWEADARENEVELEAGTPSTGRSASRSRRRMRS